MAQCFSLEDVRVAKPLSMYIQTIKLGDVSTYLKTLMRTMRVKKVMDYRNVILTFVRCVYDGPFTVSRLAQISN